MGACRSSPPELPPRLRVYRHSLPTRSVRPLPGRVGWGSKDVLLLGEGAQSIANLPNSKNAGEVREQRVDDQGDQLIILWRQADHPAVRATSSSGVTRDTPMRSA